MCCTNFVHVFVEVEAKGTEVILIKWYSNLYTTHNIILFIYANNSSNIIKAVNLLYYIIYFLCYEIGLKGDHIPIYKTPMIILWLYSVFSGILVINHAIIFVQCSMDHNNFSGIHLPS